jgi:sugar/nucleoside kinase (ribokinase family)
VVQQRRFDILGVGTVAVDDFLYIAAYPGPDEKAEVLSSSRGLGGLVGTALAAAVRLGSRCAYAGIVGTDGFSGEALQGLQRAGVDCSLAQRRPEAGVVHALIVVGAKGNTRNIFFRLGMVPLPGGALEQRSVSGSRVLLVDQLGLEAARQARRLGVPVVADLDWPEYPRLDELLEVVDHLIVSRQFAATRVGGSDPERWLRALQGGTARVCTAVTVGQEGCYFLLGEEQAVQSQPAFPARVVETTGCGDVFHGGYAAALARGEGPRSALRYGAAAAALYASRPSGWDQLPTQVEVEGLLERHPAKCRQRGERG